MRINPLKPEGRFSRSRARLSKRILIPILCVLALVVTLFAVLRSLFPSQVLRDLAIAKLEETTGLSISVEDATISFIHWRIGVKVSGVEISAPAAQSGAQAEHASETSRSREAASGVPRGAAGVIYAASTQPSGLPTGSRDSTGRVTQIVKLATIPELGIVVSVLPLFKKEIVVDELYVEKPQITLRLGEAPILRRPQGKPAAGPAAMAMSLSLSKAVLTDADVELRDVRTGNIVELKHIEASTSVKIEKDTGTIVFEGKSSVKQVLLNSATKLPLEIPPLTARMSWKGGFGLKDRVLDLERISVKVAEFPIEVTGKINLAGDKPDLDVKVRIEKIAAEKLLGFVPRKFAERLEGVRIDGQIEASARILGRMPSPEVNIERFAVSLGGSSVNGRALLKTGEPPSVDFESSGNLKLDELARFFPVSKGPRVTSGTASFRLVGGGSINELKANPLSLRVQGEASINSVTVELPGSSLPVVLNKAHMIVSGRSLEITQASVRTGSSVFNATGRVRDWQEREVELEVSSQMLDLGELLLPIAKQQKASRKEVTRMAVPATGIPARGRARVQVDKLRFGNFAASDLKAQVVFGGDSIVVSDVTMNTLGGKCRGKSRLVLPKEGARAYRASFSADNLEMRELLNCFTPVRDFMSGLSFFEISVEGNLPDNVSPLNSLAAKGQVKTTQGKAIASPLVSTIASWVGLEKRDEYALKDFATSFLVQDGRLILPQCRLEDGNSTWDLVGSTGFDGTLDYRVSVTLSQDCSKRTSSLRGLDQLVKDAQGRVVVDLIVAGTVKKPALRWDSSRMQQRTKELIARKVRDQIEGQTRKGEALKQEVKVELEKKSDSLKVETAKKGVKLLKDLLKKRKK